MAEPQINSKSLARIAAVQTLYQYRDNTQDVETLLQRMSAFYKDDMLVEEFKLKEGVKLKISHNHLRQLVEYSCNNLEDINQRIAELLPDKERFTSTPKLLLAILQVAICELIFFPETPRKVVINEFTNIANSMLNQNEIGFVNSILDKITI